MSHSNNQKNYEKKECVSSIPITLPMGMTTTFRGTFPFYLGSCFHHTDSPLILIYNYIEILNTFSGNVSLLILMRTGRCFYDIFLPAESPLPARASHQQINTYPLSPPQDHFSSVKKGYANTIIDR
ncbi:MAG TPA: hypothetical protein PKG69_03970, partial [Methanoregulaceae archaeon]|nr:hypothetical protein [Methanoregulaceae archaeon]